MDTNNEDNSTHTYNITIDMNTGETITKDMNTNTCVVSNIRSSSCDIDDLSEEEKIRAHKILNEILIILEKLKMKTDDEGVEILHSMPYDTAVTILTIMKLFDEERYVKISAMSGIEADEIED